MTSVVLKSLSILLGIFFIFVGATKLTQSISKELHKDLRKEFVRYSKVFPLSTLLNFKVPSKWFRRTVGCLEVVCGFSLGFIPCQRIKQLANFILLTLMLFATYNHYMVGDKFERLAPSLVFFFMLSCRLIVSYQLKRTERIKEEEIKKRTEEASTPAQAKPKPFEQKKHASKVTKYE